MPNTTKDLNNQTKGVFNLDESQESTTNVSIDKVEEEFIKEVLGYSTLDESQESTTNVSYDIDDEFYDLFIKDLPEESDFKGQEERSFAIFEKVDNLRLGISFLDKKDNLYELKLSNEEVSNKFRTKEEVIEHASNQFDLNYQETTLKKDNIKKIFRDLITINIELLEYKDTKYNFVFGSYVLDPEMGEIYDKHNLLLGELNRLGLIWDKIHMDYAGSLLYS